MKNVLEQFRRRYLISRSRNSQKDECHSYPVSTLKKQNFANHFLSTSLHTNTDISSKCHVSNFNSQDTLFYIYNNPILPICAPWNLNFEKCRNSFLVICMKNVLAQFRRRYLIFRSRKCQNHKCRKYPRFTLWAPWNMNLQKCRNWFLGICMRNILVQFRIRYFILRPRKSQKHECHR